MQITKKRKGTYHDQITMVRVVATLCREMQGDAKLHHPRNAMFRDPPEIGLKH